MWRHRWGRGCCWPRWPMAGPARSTNRWGCPPVRLATCCGRCWPTRIRRSRPRWRGGPRPAPHPGGPSPSRSPTTGGRSRRYPLPGRSGPVDQPAHARVDRALPPRVVARHLVGVGVRVGDPGSLAAAVRAGSSGRARGRRRVERTGQPGAGVTRSSLGAGILVAGRVARRARRRGPGRFAGRLGDRSTGGVGRGDDQPSPCRGCREGRAGGLGVRVRPVRAPARRGARLDTGRSRRNRRQPTMLGGASGMDHLLRVRPGPPPVAGIPRRVRAAGRQPRRPGGVGSSQTGGPGRVRTARLRRRRRQRNDGGTWFGAAARSERHLRVRFGRPYAVVAYATHIRGRRIEPLSPWHGLPVFSGWVAQPTDAAHT